MPKTNQQKRAYHEFIITHWLHILLMYVAIPVCAVVLAFGFIRPSMVAQHGYWYKLVITLLVLVLAYALGYITQHASVDTKNAINRLFANENKDLVNRVDKIYQNYLDHDYVYYSMIIAIICVVITLIALLVSVFIRGLLPVAYVALDLTIVSVIVMFELDSLY